jgi:hypothetical protein
MQAIPRRHAAGSEKQPDASPDRFLLQLRIDIVRLGNALAKLCGGNEAGAQQFAAAPRHDTCPTTIGDIHDGTFDLHAIRLQDDKCGLLKFDSAVLALAELNRFSHDGPPADEATQQSLKEG